jgi:hypothetical protein
MCVTAISKHRADYIQQRDTDMIHFAVDIEHVLIVPYVYMLACHSIYARTSMPIRNV